MSHRFSMSDQPRACVVGYVSDGDGRVLLGRRLKRDGGFGKWVLPGGGIQERETFAEALRREIGEECQLDLDYTGPILGVYRHIEGPTNNVVVLLDAVAYGSPRGSDELEIPQFFTPEEIDKLDTTPATRHLVALARAGIRMNSGSVKP